MTVAGQLANLELGEKDNQSKDPILNDQDEGAEEPDRCGRDNLMQHSRMLRIKDPLLDDRKKKRKGKKRNSRFSNNLSLY